MLPKPNLPCRVAVATLTSCLVLAACSSPGDQKSFKSEKSPIAASPKAVLPSIPATQAGATDITFKATPEKVSATYPRFTKARNLSMAVEVIKGRMLRDSWQQDASDVNVTSQIIASSDAVLGVLVTNTTTIRGKKQTIPASVWYSAGAKQSYSSPALVKADQWADLTTALQDAGKDQSLDGSTIAAAAKAKSAPYGNGPALGFDHDGDLLATFASGVLSDNPTTLVVPSGKARGMLSSFGTQAQKASTNPGKFTGTTSQPVDESLESTDISTRPSTAVGPDCRVLHCVAVTYDDGPSAMTPELLDTIKKFKLSITFFQMGNSIKAFPETAQKVAAAGMEIGNHTVTHPNLPVKTPDRIRRELEHNSQLIKGFMGATPLLFRPPYGAHNDTVDEVAKDNGMAIVQWQIDSEDWKNRNPGMTYKNVMTALPYTAPIILEHDIQKASIDAAPRIYRDLEAKGKTIVSVSEISLNTGGYQAGHAYCNGTVKEQSGYNCKG
ncbi:polysaccharide deacetylase family protein [Cutibacterium sp. WCA-380-WT-3A]|uniref:Polysaccharide deacetylase family protein n=1 Tax=Cutibacterium porci TaxID=2605781 RepID=A0A7K0J8U5_9ACTN|nr:polysaccharide deacetylase family protein [Cutibacterium porci]MSS46369.1 polysaccharide deacetylase family protein [Cutibacterium porci]